VIGGKRVAGDGRVAGASSFPPMPTMKLSSWMGLPNGVGHETMKKA